MADKQAIDNMTPFEIMSGLKAGIALAHNEVEDYIHNPSRLQDLFEIAEAAQQSVQWTQSPLARFMAKVIKALRH